MVYQPPGIASQGSAAMIEQILKNKKLRDFYKNDSRKKKVGSEMIIIAAKKPQKTNL